MGFIQFRLDSLRPTETCSISLRINQCDLDSLSRFTQWDREALSTEVITKPPLNTEGVVSLSAILSDPNSPEVTQMIWSPSDSFRLTQVHAKPLTVIRLQQESCSLAQIHLASLRLTQLQCQQLSHSDSLSDAQMLSDPCSPTGIHSVPLRFTRSFSNLLNLTQKHSV